MADVRPCHLKTGAEGERLAKIYIENLGWKILGENVRLGKKEIDLIAMDKGSVVLVEVKTRIGDEFGTPEESITERKLYNLHTAAALYARENPGVKQIRIDVIAVEYPASGPGKPKLRHLRNVAGSKPLAFLP